MKRKIRKNIQPIIARKIIEERSSTAFHFRLPSKQHQQLWARAHSCFQRPPTALNSYMIIIVYRNVNHELLALLLYHAVFTDWFIFRHILGQFFPRKWNLCRVYERNRNIRYHKGKRNVIKKKQIIIFRSVGFADCFVGLERYSKFAPKPF